MGEVRNDMEKKKKAVAAASEEREDRKLSVKKALLARYLTRKSSDSE